MDAEISQSEQWFRFLAWLEDNWRRVAAVVSVVMVIGVIVAFVLWQGAQDERVASGALSSLLGGSESPSGDSLLAFAGEHAGTEAGKRALLLAAGALFVEGRYAEAQSGFERFLAEYPADPLTRQARFGRAACHEAQGHNAEAIADYLGVVEASGEGAVIPQARFALGNLYLQEGQPEQARVQYETLAAIRGSSLAAEAQALLAELTPAASNAPLQIPAFLPPGASADQP